MRLTVLFEAKILVGGIFYGSFEPSLNLFAVWSFFYLIQLMSFDPDIYQLGWGLALRISGRRSYSWLDFRSRKAFGSIQVVWRLCSSVVNRLE